MPRNPMTLTDAQMAEVETLAAVLTAEQVADYFGIGRRTLYDMMQRNEEIAARYKRGKAKAIGVIAHGLINKARSGDTASMIFFLKTRAGWRETSRLEHTGLADDAAAGPDMGPSAAQLVIACLDAKHRAMAASHVPAVTEVGNQAQPDSVVSGDGASKRDGDGTRAASMLPGPCAGSQG
jgi:Helix-turn-helix domain